MELALCLSIALLLIWLFSGLMVRLTRKKPRVPSGAPSTDWYWRIVGAEGVWVNEIGDFEIAWLKRRTSWKRMDMEEAKSLYPDER